MRKIAYLIGLAALGSSAALAGSNTTNLSVTANISSNCTISTAALAFGPYDPIAGTAVNGTGTVTTACTTDVTAPYVTLGQGANAHSGSTDASPLRQLSDGASHLLTYNIYSDSGRSTLFGNTNSTGNTAAAGTGTAQNMTIYGKIDANQHSAPAGNYTDTVVATVTF